MTAGGHCECSMGPCHQEQMSARWRKQDDALNRSSIYAISIARIALLPIVNSAISYPQTDLTRVSAIGSLNHSTDHSSLGLRKSEKLTCLSGNEVACHDWKVVSAASCILRGHRSCLCNLDHSAIRTNNDSDSQIVSYYFCVRDLWICAIYSRATAPVPC